MITSARQSDNGAASGSPTREENRDGRQQANEAASGNSGGCGSSYATASQQQGMAEATPRHPTPVDLNLQAVEVAELAVMEARSSLDIIKKEVEEAAAELKAAESPRDQDIATTLLNLRKQMFDVAVAELRSAMGKRDMAHRNAYPSTPGHNVHVSPFDGDSFEHLLRMSPTMSHQVGAIQDALHSLNPLLLNPWSQEAPTLRATMGDDRKNRMRKVSAKHYKAYRKNGNKARCSVTGIWGDHNTVVGAHLLPLGTTTTNVQIALNMVDKLNDPRNVIPLLKTIEEAYDKQRFCFVLDDPDGSGKQVKLRILDPALRDEIVADTKTFGELAQTPFDLPEGGENDEGPFRRCLSFHAQTGYAEAEKKGWRGIGSKPSEYGSPLDTNKISFLKMHSSTFDETSGWSGENSRT